MTMADMKIAFIRNADKLGATPFAIAAKRFAKNPSELNKDRLLGPYFHRMISYGRATPSPKLEKDFLAAFGKVNGLLESAENEKIVGIGARPVIAGSAASAATRMAGGYFEFGTARVNTESAKFRAAAESVAKTGIAILPVYSSYAESLLGVALDYAVGKKDGVLFYQIIEHAILKSGSVDAMKPGIRNAIESALRSLGQDSMQAEAGFGYYLLAVNTLQDESRKKAYLKDAYYGFVNAFHNGVKREDIWDALESYLRNAMKCGYEAKMKDDGRAVAGNAIDMYLRPIRQKRFALENGNAPTNEWMERGTNVLVSLVNDAKVLKDGGAIYFNLELPKMEKWENVL